MGRVEPVLSDHTFCPVKVVSQNRWSLITGRTNINRKQSASMKMVVQDEWSLMTEAAQDWFYCISKSVHRMWVMQNYRSCIFLRVLEMLFFFAISVNIILFKKNSSAILSYTWILLMHIISVG